MTGPRHSGGARGGNGYTSQGHQGRTRGTGTAGRPEEPMLPHDVTTQDLDSSVRRDLRGLDKTSGDTVAKHLVMASRLLDEQPQLALEHARAAARRAGRIAVVRETVGIAAYSAGEWSEALGELRAARRISGSTTLLPLMADCERGLGNPERAIDIARSVEGRQLDGDELIEMKIVEAGARIDLGEPDKAVITLQRVIDPAASGSSAARIFFAYADSLRAAGRTDDAITWFMNAAAADDEDITDAELRLMELTDPEGYARLWGDDGSPAETETVRDDGTTHGQGAAEDVADSSAANRELVSGEKLDSVEGSLISKYDAAFYDLDGTLFAGSAPIVGAVHAVEAANVGTWFVTNNASRRPDDVAAHLRELGFAATADQVVTSAQSAARMVADRLGPGALALVVGTEGLVQELREVGIATTRNADHTPAAVVQGHSPATDWAILSEAALAIRAGALWVACNVDATLPSERGLLVGNGSMVAALASATDVTPIVAGKPAAPLMRDALERSGAGRPLVVGDRLDTDIAGAHAVGLDSLLVLTGVSTVIDAMRAARDARPTYVAADLSALHREPDECVVGTNSEWNIEETDGAFTVSAAVDAPRFGVLGSLLAAAYASGIADSEIRIRAADATSATALAAHDIEFDNVHV